MKLPAWHYTSVTTRFVIANLEETKRVRKCSLDVFNEGGYKFYIYGSS